MLPFMHNMLNKFLDTLLPSYVYAAKCAESDALFCNPINSKDFYALIEAILLVLWKFGIPILVLFIVFAGFKYVTAQGNEAKVEEATKALWWSVVGGAVLLGARVIAAVIKATVGAV